MPLKENLKKYKKVIFLLELAGLFHDTGKLDSKFIDYRRKWQDGIDGWNYYNDPHEYGFFDKDLLFQKNDFNVLRKILNENITVLREMSEFPDISLKELMHQHTKPKHKLAHLLKIGDSIDSAYDRNNPLYVNEQKGDKIYSSTVFGYEKPLSIDYFDRTRGLLYHDLQSLLDGYLKTFDDKDRQNIFKKVEEAFRITVSNTIRSANDTTLWQHSYMTAALTKVFFVHYLMYGELLEWKRDEFYKYKFSIMGFGWDGLGFISRGHKIADIVSKKSIIHDLKQRIKKLIEYDYPIGMNVYDDDNGIYFIVPKLPENGNTEYAALMTDIAREVEGIANDITDGEIQPILTHAVKDTHFIIEIVRSIEDIRGKTTFPYSGNVKPEWVSKWQGVNNKEICSICGKRPIEIEDENICEICKDRRKCAHEIHDIKDVKESIFTSEIADKNGRLALIVARFNLDSWLNGDMLYSLFVKEADSFDRAISFLGEIKDFQKSDKERKKRIDNLFTPFNYTKIKKAIDICDRYECKDLADALSFLFDRHSNQLGFDGWGEIKKWLKGVVNQEIKFNHKTYKERFGRGIDLPDYLLTKNHTPSRLLNIWNTTRDFFNDLREAEFLKRECLPFKRILLEFDSDLDLHENTVYEAEINGERIEIFKRQKKIFVINPQGKDIDIKVQKEKWMGKNIIIYPSEFEKKRGGEMQKSKIKSVDIAREAIYPYRTITPSPNLFMMIIPADKSIEITEWIYQRYIEHFGKVMGRLPFSIGNIFFDEKMPIFVVLDAGRRMIDNFDRIAKEHEIFVLREDVNAVSSDYIFELKGKIGKLDKTITWQLSFTLGNCCDDYHHPCFITHTASDDRGTYFKTVIGDVIHFSEIKKDDSLKIYPSYYDFEFLDSNARRHDIGIDDKGRRKSNVADFKSKPFLLDELNQKIKYLWKSLLQGKQLKGITDTKLRNLQSLWLTKYQEWQVNIKDKSSAQYKQWWTLVKFSIEKEFPQIDPKQQEILFEAIENGLFFDTLELYLGILKERIETK
jgi:CRISPR-associated Csx11 family protein